MSQPRTPKPSSARRRAHVYRDRRRGVIWALPLRAQNALLVAVAVLALLAVGQVCIALSRSASAPKPEPTPKPTDAPAATEIPAVTDAPEEAPKGVVLPTSQAILEGPPFTIQNRDDLMALFWWMIQNGEETAELKKLSLSKDEVRSAAELFSNYFESYAMTTSGSRIRVEYKAGVKALAAIEADDLDELDDSTRAVAERAQALVDRLISPEMTPLERELILHDYVADNCEYLSVVQGEHTTDARGFFESGLCQCAGYVDTYRLLARLAGLDVEMIGGPTTRDTSGVKGHAWNLIRLDGLWYVVDVTWDDMIAGSSGREHVFFNVPFFAFGSSRSWDEAACPPGYYADELDGNYYFNQPRYAASDAAAALDVVTRQLDAGGNAYVLYTGDESLSAAGEALRQRYGDTLSATELSQDLDFDVYRFVMK